MARTDFEPVFLDEPLGARVSMTMLKHFNGCPRAGYLYARHRRRGVQTVEMVRGSAVHAIKERCTRAMLDAGERQIPPELAKAIVAEVLAEFPVPIEEHDYIRESSHRWASEWQLFEDEKVIGLETLFVLEVAGWAVRCKVDFATLRETDGLLHVHVEDYKSGRGVPSFDDVSRKRRDGTIAAKNLQLILYVLAIVFGRPVTTERELCVNCNSASGAPDLCTSCAGTGFTVRETVGEQVARGCQEASAEFVFPGVEDSNGLMMRRPVTLTRLEMLEYLESLETIVQRLERAEQSGDWPAVASQKACDECPCVQECPIPAELNDYAGRINTPEEAAEAMQRMAVVKRQASAFGRELRAFVKALPGSRMVVGDTVAEFAVRRSETIKDKDGFYAALAAGTLLEQAREEFVRVSEGTTFVERELSEDERAEAAG